DGSVLSVDALKVLDPNAVALSAIGTRLSDLTAKDAQAAPAGTLYDSSKVTSRTFLDADGNPAMSISLIAAAKVTGVSKFNLDTDGSVLSVDALKVLTPNAIDLSAIGTHLSDLTAKDAQATPAGTLYDSSKVTSRTFLDADGNPAMSIS